MGEGDWIALIVVLGIGGILGGLFAFFGIKRYKF